jgi:hypothetical protein
MRKLKDDKKIRWTENYTDKSEYLQRMYNDIVGKNSYWRFEGEQLDGPGEWYVVISPAGVVGEHERKFFAGIRKLPDKWPAGGKKFDSLVDAFTYAADTWGVPKPHNLPRYSGQDLVGIGKRIDEWKAENEEDEKVEKESSDNSKMKKEAMPQGGQQKGGLTWHLSEISDCKDIYVNAGNDETIASKIDAVYAKIVTNGVAAALRMNINPSGGTEGIPYDFPNLPHGRVEAQEAEAFIGRIFSLCDNIGRKYKSIEMPPSISIKNVEDMFAGRTMTSGTRMHGNCKFLAGLAKLSQDNTPVSPYAAEVGKSVNLQWLPHTGESQIAIDHDSPVVVDLSVDGNVIISNQRATQIQGSDRMSVIIPIPEGSPEGIYIATWRFVAHGRQMSDRTQFEVAPKSSVSGVMKSTEYADYEARMFFDSADYRTLSMALISYMERQKIARLLPGRPEVVDTGNRSDREAVEKRSSIERAIQTESTKYTEEKATYIKNNIERFSNTEHGPYPSGRSARRAWLAAMVATVPDNEVPIVDFIEYSKVEAKPRLLRISPYRPGTDFVVGYEIHSDVFESPQWEQIEELLRSHVDGINIASLVSDFSGKNNNEFGTRYNKAEKQMQFENDVSSTFAGTNAPRSVVDQCTQLMLEACRGNVMSKSTHGGLIRVKTSTGKRRLLKNSGSHYFGILNIGSTSSKDDFLPTLFRSMVGAEDAILMTSDLRAGTDVIVDHLNENNILPAVAQHLSQTPRHRNSVWSAVSGTVVFSGVGHGLFTGDRISVSDSSEDGIASGSYPVTVIDEESFSIPVNLNVQIPEGAPSHQGVATWQKDIPQSMTPKEFSDYCRRVVGSQGVRAPYPGDIFNIFTNTAPMRVHRDAIEEVSPAAATSLDGHYDASGRISTPDMYRVMSEEGVPGNISSIISAVIDEDGGASSLSLFEHMGASISVGVMHDTRGTHMPHVSIGTLGKFKLLNALIGDVWGLKEKSPDVYKRFLKYNMFPSSMDDSVASDALESLESGDFDRFSAIVSNHLSSESTVGFDSLVSFQDEDGLNVPLPRMGRRNRESVLANRFKKIQGLVAEEYYRSIVEFSANVNEETIVNMVSKMNYAVPEDLSSVRTVESTDTSLPIVTVGEPVRGSDLIRNDRVVTGVRLDNESGPVMAVSDLVLDNGNRSVSQAMGNSKWAKSFKSTHKPFTYTVNRGGSKYSPISDSMSTHRGMKSSEPPVLKSQGFPPASLEKFSLQAAAGTFGVHSIPCMITPSGPKLNIPDSAISEDVWGMTVRDANSSLPPQSESSRVIADSLTIVLDEVKRRSESSQYPVMWWRGEAGDDIIENKDISTFLDISSASAYFSGDYRLSVDQVAFMAREAAEEAILGEVFHITSMNESGQGGDEISRQVRAISDFLDGQRGADGSRFTQSVAVVDNYIDESASQTVEDEAENAEEELAEEMVEEVAESVLDTDIPDDEEDLGAISVPSDISQDVSISPEETSAVEQDDFDEEEFDSQFAQFADFDEEEFDSQFAQFADIDDDGFDDPIQPSGTVEETGFGDDIINDLTDEEQSEEVTASVKNIREKVCEARSCTMREALKVMISSSKRLVKEGKMGKAAEINKIIRRYLDGTGLQF